MVKCCRITSCRKLHCSDADLTHPDPSLFIKSRIPVNWSPWVAIVWNTVWFVYFTIILFVDIFYFTERNRKLWIIYLSHWCFLLAMVTTLTEAFVRLYMVKRTKETDKDNNYCSEDMCWMQKVQWVMYTTNNVVSLSMTIVYYSLNDIDMSVSSVSKHILSSVYVILNTSIVSSIPVKIFHFYQPAVFFIIYAIFISIYQQVTPYSGLLVVDRDNATKTSIILGILIVIGPPFLHCLFYCAYNLREYFLETCSISGSSLPLTSTMQRDITATDVVLEDSGSPEFIDIKPDVKDDILIKSTSSANVDAFQQLNGRLNKSETDLRDYRLRNGLYCEFARSSLILHTRNKSASDIFGDDSDLESVRTKTPERKGSQIIVVKKCQTCEDDVEDEENDAKTTDCDSNASSDYLSQYFTEDILAYL